MRMRCTHSDEEEREETVQGESGEAGDNKGMVETVLAWENTSVNTENLGMVESTGFLSKTGKASQ